MTSDESVAEVQEITIVDLDSSWSLRRRRRTTVGPANVGVTVRARIQGDAEVMLRLGIEMGLVSASVAGGSTIRAVQMLPMYFPITATYTIGSDPIDNGAFLSSALAVHAATFIEIDAGQVTGASLAHVAPEPVGVLTYRLFASDIASYSYARRVQLNMTTIAATGVLDVSVGSTLYSATPVRAPATTTNSQKATAKSSSSTLVWVLLASLAFLLCLLPTTILVVYQRSKRKQERMKALSDELLYQDVVPSKSPAPTSLYSQLAAVQLESSPGRPPSDDGEYLQLADGLLDMAHGVLSSAINSPTQSGKEPGLSMENSVPLDLGPPGLNSWGDEQLPAQLEATLSGKYVTDAFLGTLSGEQQDRLRRNCQGSVSPVAGTDKKPLGIHARHASDYSQFSALFTNIMADYHGLGNNFVHVNSWDIARPTAGIGGPLLDMSQTSIPKATVKVKVSRNFGDLPLSPAMQLSDRLSLEKRMVETFSDSGLAVVENGSIYSLTPGSPHFVDNARYDKLVARRQMFAQPPISPEPGCIGTLGEDWPSGRCCFVSSDNSLMVWVGGEDHIQVIVQMVTDSYLEPYTRAQEVVRLLETRTGIFARSEKFGWITACPTRLGSALSSQTCIELPFLQDSDFDAACHVCSTRGVTLKRANGAHMFALMAQGALCVTEGEMISNVWDAMIALGNEHQNQLSPNRTSGATGGGRGDGETSLTASAAARSADLLGRDSPSHYHPQSAATSSPDAAPMKARPPVDNRYSQPVYATPEPIVYAPPTSTSEPASAVSPILQAVSPILQAVSPSPATKKTRKLYAFEPEVAVAPTPSPKKARKLFEIESVSVSPKATPVKDRALVSPVQAGGEGPSAIGSTTTAVKTASNPAFDTALAPASADSNSFFAGSNFSAQVIGGGDLGAAKAWYE